MDLSVVPLSREAFAPFGAVIEEDAARAFAINDGRTMRHHALATLDVEGEAGISIFSGRPSDPPIEIAMMERHPRGSQAFVPLFERAWLAVVAHDEDGRPGKPQAFLATGRQGVQYGRNVWHHPLLVLKEESDFLVVDRLEAENNLETSRYAEPYRITSLQAS